MGAKTEISWTHHTFNPWWGCTRVSPGCVHCYAETFAKRVGVAWGPQAERRFFGDKHWNEPLKWNRLAEAAGERRRVFCASMADVFEDRPELILQRVRLWELIEATPGLDWLLLTKRPENADGMTPTPWRLRGWPRHVWAMTTAEDQQRADERIPHLLRLPAAVLGLSCEPLLGPLDIRQYLAGRSSKTGACLVCGHPVRCRCEPPLPSVDWVIVGGESGPGARPFDPEWARSTIRQCREAGVAVFVKQLGKWIAASAHGERPYCAQTWLFPDGSRFVPPLIGANAFAKPEGAIAFCQVDAKGGNWDEWPEDLRVREFPREVTRARG